MQADSSSSHSPLLLTTRFLPPRIPTTTLARPALQQRLQHALTHPFTIITAPAGSGKSTSMAILYNQQSTAGWHTAWLSLEETEQDPQNFWTYLLSAITRATSLQPIPFSTTDQFLISLINTLSEQITPLLLVLDNYHLAESPQLNTQLLFFIKHLPPTTHLVLISRLNPAFPLTHLRVQRQLDEIHNKELAFSLAETHTFLEQILHLQLPSTTIATLHARTEGWIAGLQLAALSLSHHQDDHTLIENISGTNRYIGDYLLNEVLTKQPPTTQHFLLCTSILSRLSAQLCNAVTAQDNGQAMLEQLEASHIFLVSLDHNRQWYRYHHLFSDMLRTHLAQNNPSLFTTCHERAAQWFAAQGETQSAIKHALAANNDALAATLMTTSAEQLLQRGNITTILSWHTALPPTILPTYPDLTLTFALAQLMHGHTNTAAQTLQHLASIPPHTLPTHLQGKLSIIRAFQLLSIGDFAQVQSLIQQALQQLSSSPSVIRDFAELLSNTIQSLFQEDTTAIIHALTQTANTSLQHGNYLISSFALQNRVIKEYAQGSLYQVERTCQEALHNTTLLNEQELPFASWAYLHLGEVYREWNQLTKAHDLLKQAIDQPSLKQHPEVIIDGYIALARTYHAWHRPEETQHTLTIMERFIQHGQVAPHTAWQIDACRARLHYLHGHLNDAIRWAERYQHDIQQTTTPLSSALTDFSNFTLARIFIAQHKEEAARSLLSHLHTIASTQGRQRSVIEANLLLALLSETTNQRDTALTHLANALHLAATDNFVRIFLDEGQPIINLLTRYLTTHTIPSDLHTQTTPYAQKLLTHHTSIPLSSPTNPSSTNSSSSSIHSATPPNLSSAPQPALLLEPLSARELEILHLLAAGKSNNDIANELFLALSTIKWHIMHLYQKLGVNTRTQAITRARSLNLIRN